MRFTDKIELIRFFINFLFFIKYRKNVSWQATCNSTGYVCGFFIGNGMFILLESADFCNRILRPIFKLQAQKSGFIDIQSKFLYLFTLLSVQFLFSSFILSFLKILS